MKIVLLFLILLNVLFYGWSSWVAKQPLELAVVTPEPEAEPLVLYEEKYPERARAEREAKERVARDARLAKQEAARLEQEALAARAEATATELADGAAGPDPRAVDEAGTPGDVPDREEGRAPGSDEANAPPVDEIVEAPASLVAADTGSDSNSQADAPPADPPVAPAPGAEQTARPEPGPADGPAATEVPEAALAALDELAESAAAATPAPTVAMTRDGPQAARCVSLGPFINPRDTAQANAVLRELGLETLQREEQARIWVGHWVYLPPTKTRAEAIAVVEKLREDGVSDLYIETSGERRNAISLGLFSDAAGAETRAGKIRKLDVRPEIRDRYRDGTLYWLDFDLAPGEDVDPTRFEGGSARRTIRLEERDCGRDTAAG